MTLHCRNTLHEWTNNRLGRAEKHLQRIDRLCAEGGDAEAIYNQLGGLMRQVELLSREVRASVLELHAGLEALGLTPPERPLPGAPDVKIAEDNGVYRIQMDGLLPFSGRGNVYWLHSMMDNALQCWREENGYSVPVFQSRAAVVFRHHYSRDQPRSVQDYDHLEFACILNTLSRHFLTDDNPAGYVLVHTAMAGEKAFTEVLVMDLNVFQRMALEGMI